MRDGSPSVLFVPDSIYWITGVLAQSFARFNPQIQSTVISAPVLERLLQNNPSIADRFDLVHYLCPYASAAGLERFSGRMPVVTSHHHVTDWDWVKHNASGDAVICGSTEWLNDLVMRGVTDGRAVVVPYGVDTEVFTAATGGDRINRKRSLGLGDGPVVGFFGKSGSNDDDRKGIARFIDEVKRLAALEPTASVLLVGPGWRELQARIRATGLRCVWIPYVAEHADLALYYGALDFYWVTARIEGGPVPLLEAMSCEVSSLSTPVGVALDAIVDGVNGIIVPHDVPSAFATATSEKWRDAAQLSSIGNAARRTIRESFDDAVTAPQIINAYRRAEENFSLRTGIRRGLDWNDAPVPGFRPPRVSAPPLDALSRSEERQARTLELQFWGDRLSREGQDRKSAARALRNAWLTRPASLEMLRIYLRHALPVPLVNGAVRAKRAVRRLASP